MNLSVSSGDIEWSIGRIVEKWAMAAPERPALIIGGKATTYAGINSRANRIASLLLSLGTKKGDRVAAYAENSLDTVCLYIAAAKLGLICVPLNNRLLSDEILYQLSDSGTSALFFDLKFADRIEAAVRGTGLPADRVFCVGAEEGCKIPAWSTSCEAALTGHADRNPIPQQPVLLGDPIAIIYTSGTTGAPKGAVVTHLQTYFKCFQVILYLDMRADDVYLTHMPLFHSAGLFIAVTPALCRGATILTHRKFDPQRFVDDAEAFNATIVMGSTTMWRFILRDYDKERSSFASVRVAFGGGERTPLSLIEELQEIGLAMQLGFGQTENSFMALQQADEVFDHFGSVGRPGFFTDIWIDDGKGGPAAAGEIGPILARGPTVMSGYWQMPDKTEETIVDGVLKTGDVGYMDEDLHLHLVDREKDMYRSGAENVYPAEVERLLMDHPAVDNVAIIGVPDDDWGETGKAFIVPAGDGEPDADELLDFLDGKLARYKLPKHFEFVRELPMTETGKVKKVVLKKLEKAKIAERSAS